MANRDFNQSKRCFILEKRKEPKKEMAIKCVDPDLSARKKEDDR